MLQIFNTLTRSKETFVPIEPGKVKMYVCGMTVYDYCHIGHARVMVVFDMVQRWLRASGLEVTYVRNITDIDDKIINRSIQNNESIQSLTQRYINEMNADAKALGVISPSKEPKATEHIEDMLSMIQRLIEKQHAYLAKNGDIFYSVRSFNEYGKLSGKSIEDLRAGERVDIDQNKHDELDFVLWKSAKPNEPSWDSPWGKGRPGWHIECSAMSSHYLGHHFDIHGGGMDLKFPHHECEIAQAKGAYDRSPVKYWMHTNMLTVNGQKMSKSLGNSFLPSELIAGSHPLLEQPYSPMTVRFFMLQSQYRSTLDFSNEALKAAQKGYKRLANGLKIIRGMEFPTNVIEAIDEKHVEEVKKAVTDRKSVV